MRNVELLMPAGNLEKLEYAVRDVQTPIAAKEKTLIKR